MRPNATTQSIAVIGLSILLAACDVVAPPQPVPPRLTPIAVPSPAPQPTTTPVSRTTQPVVKGSIQQSIQVTGNLIPAKQVPVNPPVAGVLIDLRVRQGDSVKEGEVLGTVTVADAETKRLDTQQRLIRAKIDLEQTKANPPDLASKVVEAEMAVELLKIELGKQERRNYERELFLAKRAAERTEANALSLRSIWDQLKWKNTPEVWDLGGRAEQAEDAAVQAKERLQELIDSKELRERELKTLKRRIENADRQVTTLKQTEQLQQQAYQLQIELLQSAVAEGQKALDRITAGVELRTPIAGMVTAINASSGETVDPTRPILIIAEPKVAKAAVNLLETDIVHIAIGQAAMVHVPALGETGYEAKVSWIATMAQPDKEPTFQVILDLDKLDNRAKIGMTASARIGIERRDSVLLVPNSAIRSRSGRRFVETVADGAVTEVPVELGIRTEAETEVLSGLSEGQLIVVGARPSGESSRP